MGGGVSLHQINQLPDYVDRDLFNKLVKDKKFAADVYDHFADREDGYISRQRLQELVLARDAFLSFEWGIDYQGHSVLRRVQAITDYLVKKKGLVLYVEEGHYRNNTSMLNKGMRERIRESLSHCQCMIVFFTERYFQKFVEPKKILKAPVKQPTDLRAPSEKVIKQFESGFGAGGASGPGGIGGGSAFVPTKKIKPAPGSTPATTGGTASGTPDWAVQSQPTAPPPVSIDIEEYNNVQIEFQEFVRLHGTSRLIVPVVLEPKGRVDDPSTPKEIKDLFSHRLCIDMTTPPHLMGSSPNRNQQNEGKSHNQPTVTFSNNQFLDHEFTAQEHFEYCCEQLYDYIMTTINHAPLRVGGDFKKRNMTKKRSTAGKLRKWMEISLRGDPRGIEPDASDERIDLYTNLLVKANIETFTRMLVLLQQDDLYLEKLGFEPRHAKRVFAMVEKEVKASLDNDAIAMIDIIMAKKQKAFEEEDTKRHEEAAKAIEDSHRLRELSLMSGEDTLSYTMRAMQRYEQKEEKFDDLRIKLLRTIDEERKRYEDLTRYTLQEQLDNAEELQYLREKSDRCQRIIDTFDVEESCELFRLIIIDLERLLIAQANAQAAIIEQRRRDVLSMITTPQRSRSPSDVFGSLPTGPSRKRTSNVGGGGLGGSSRSRTSSAHYGNRSPTQSMDMIEEDSVIYGASSKVLSTSLVSGGGGSLSPIGVSIEAGTPTNRRRAASATSVNSAGSGSSRVGSPANQLTGAISPSASPFTILQVHGSRPITPMTPGARPMLSRPNTANRLGFIPLQEDPVINTANITEMTFLFQQSLFILHKIQLLCLNNSENVTKFVDKGIVKLLVTLVSKGYMYQCYFPSPFEAFMLAHQDIHLDTTFAHFESTNVGAFPDDGSLFDEKEIDNESSTINGKEHLILHLPQQAVETICTLCQCRLDKHSLNEQVVYLFGKSGTIDLMFEIIRYHLEDYSVVSRCLECINLLLSSIQQNIRQRHIQSVLDNYSNIVLLMLLLEKYDGIESVTVPNSHAASRMASRPGSPQQVMNATLVGLQGLSPGNGGGTIEYVLEGSPKEKEKQREHEKEGDMYQSKTFPYIDLRIHVIAIIVKCIVYSQEMTSNHVGHPHQTMSGTSGVPMTPNQRQSLRLISNNIGNIPDMDPTTGGINAGSSTNYYQKLLSKCRPALITRAINELMTWYMKHYPYEKIIPLQERLKQAAKKRGKESKKKKKKQQQEEEPVEYESNHVMPDDLLLSLLNSIELLYLDRRKVYFPHHAFMHDRDSDDEADKEEEEEEEKKKKKQQKKKKVKTKNKNGEPEEELTEAEKAQQASETSPIKEKAQIKHASTKYRKIKRGKKSLRESLCIQLNEYLLIAFIIDNLRLYHNSSVMIIQCLRTLGNVIYNRDDLRRRCNECSTKEEIMLILRESLQIFKYHIHHTHTYNTSHTQSHVTVVRTNTSALTATVNAGGMGVNGSGTASHRNSAIVTSSNGGSRPSSPEQTPVLSKRKSSTFIAAGNAAMAVIALTSGTRTRTTSQASISSDRGGSPPTVIENGSIVSGGSGGKNRLQVMRSIGNSNVNGSRTRSPSPPQLLDDTKKDPLPDDKSYDSTTFRPSTQHHKKHVNPRKIAMEMIRECLLTLSNMFTIIAPQPILSNGSQGNVIYDFIHWDAIHYCIKDGLIELLMDIFNQSQLDNKLLNALLIILCKITQRGNYLGCNRLIAVGFIEKVSICNILV